MPLNHQPGYVIQHLLIDLALGTNPLLGEDWATYYSVLPDTPENAIVVLDASPQSDGRSHPTGEYLWHYNFGVRVRAETQPKGYTKAKAIFDQFETTKRQLVQFGPDTYRVEAIHLTSTVRSVGREGASTRRMHEFSGVAPIQLMEALDLPGVGTGG